WAVTLKSLDGTDAGVEVIYKTTTLGGVTAVAGLLKTVRDRLNGGQYGGKVVPIVLLEKSDYVRPTATVSHLDSTTLSHDDEFTTRPLFPRKRPSMEYLVKSQ